MRTGCVAVLLAACVTGCLREAVRLDSISPGSGPSPGGTSVVLRGRGFSDATGVFFGALPATDVVVLDEHTVQARTPPGSGLVDVVVVSHGKTARLAGGFRYGTVEEQPGCRVISTFPAYASTGLGVGELPVVDYDQPVLTPVAATLTRLDDGAIVPVATQVQGGRVTVVPARNLRFWSSYALEVAPVGCEPVGLAFSTYAPVPLPTTPRPAPATEVVLVGRYAITSASTYRGLQVYDVSAPADPLLVAELPLFVPPQRLVLDGTRLYVTAGSAGILVVDVTDPRALELLAVVGTQGGAADVAPFHRGDTTFLAVADTVRGTRIIDLGDLDRPRELASIHTGSGADSDARAVAVRGDELWIAGGRDGLFVLSIAAPAVPVLVGHYPTPGIATGVTLADDRWVYATRAHYGLDVIDAADPSQPILVETAVGPSGVCSFACVDVFDHTRRDGNRLLAPVGRLGVAEYLIEADGGLSFTRTLTTSGSASGAIGSGSLVLTASSDGLGTWGASETAPLSLPDGPGTAISVVLSGELAYVAAGTRGLETWRLTAQAPSGVLIDRDATPAVVLRDDQVAMGVALDRQSVLVADGRRGVSRFSLTDPADPVLAGSAAEPLDTTQEIVVDEARRLAFACAGNGGIAVFDLAASGDPVQRALLPFSTPDLCGALALRGTHLYVGGRALHTADVGVASAPAWVGVAPFARAESIVGLALAGDDLLASTNLSHPEGIGGRVRTLTRFDLGDPAHPVVVARTHDVGGAGRITVGGGKAFVAGGSGVLVFDLEPIVPFFEGKVVTPGEVVDVALGSGRLHTAELGGGLRAIELGPLRP
jgi:hypothetical protein